MRVIGYTTYGSVRGQCGHTHATPGDAQWCLERDRRGCEGSGGYSDRQVAEIGADGLLYRSVAQDDWVPGPGGRTNGAARFRATA